MSDKPKKRKKKYAVRSDKIKPDYAHIERMARFMFTDDEMAASLEISQKTIQRWREADPLFREAMAKGHANGRKSLRSSQFKSAITDGNITMQIWLGKQYLNQKDRNEFTGPGGTPLQPAVIYLPDNGRQKRN